MDRKNFVLGILCLALAFGLMIRQDRQMHRPIPSEQITTTSNAASPQPLPRIESAQPILPKAVIKPIDERIITLENDFVRVNFTNCGGAIRTVALKKYPAELNRSEPYIFNQNADLPALGLGWKVNDPLCVKDYQVSKCTEDFIQFVTQLDDGTEIVRGYRLPASNADNPYLILHETLIKGSRERRQICFHLGIFPATSGDKYQEYLNFGAFDGKKAEFIKVGDFEASNGFLGLGQKAGRDFVQMYKSFNWGSIKNQFFTAILTPQVPALGYYAAPGKILLNERLEACISGQLFFDLQEDNHLLSMKYYVGPKDFLLLNKMGNEQDQVMQFGFFGGISKLLLIAMRGIHTYIPNWGWTIILLTFIIKLLMWPLTQAQLHSSKRMASIQQPLREIREKFKSNPQKLQAETMKLFKAHRVNPAMGCLPLLVQLPIFLGLYFMLRTSSEMRFQAFLWIKDLSVPDTVAHWGVFPVNILPILMGITMIVQMRLMPTPAIDNMQQKMLMWMPLLFLVFCYSFPAALVLYWTIQNVFTILQQELTNRFGKAEKQAITPLTQ
ncbi:MAG: membrane protein insertase YidC [Puniceicoccales bacterium]|jgi:YidC/Oxa1 family membrane protein insertase|nr:membrane protein insertase YidC [Puniceicoccales bacterium]